MIDIPIDQLPQLEYFQINFDTFGAVVNEGVLVHYVMTDIARLVTWEDIVLLGSGGCINATPPADEIREIERPVVP